jgi:predicted glycoside hydrolase/deacetylase ChbG (UPF0249 family)
LAAPTIDQLQVGMFVISAPGGRTLLTFWMLTSGATATMARMALRIIVNADDLGISALVNDSVFDLLDRKRISTATLIANGPAIESATRQANRFSDGTFGIHLNATQFAPLTSNPGLLPLLDSSGQFAGNRIRQIWLARNTRDALRSEWIAQIERLQRLGISPRHIDSHHHVHTIPALFGVLKDVQKHTGIRRVRTTMNLYPRNAPASRALIAKKWLWAKALRNIYSTRTTRWFTSSEVFHERFEEFAGRRTSLELMTHPGGVWLAASEEVKLLESDWLAALGPSTQLIRYSDL